MRKIDWGAESRVRGLRAVKVETEYGLPKLRLSKRPPLTLPYFLGHFLGHFFGGRWSDLGLFPRSRGRLWGLFGRRVLGSRPVREIAPGRRGHCFQSCPKR